MPTLDLFYEEFGAAHKPPVIILHGFFASSRNWRQIAKLLSEDYHVYVLDMRNHGASPHSSPMDYPTMAEDVKHFMQVQQLDTAHIIGHSMGGKVAMWFALHHPERVSKLIVVDIAPVSYQHSFDTMIETLQSLPLANLTNRKQADDWLSSTMEDSGFRQFLLQNLVLQEGSYRWRIDLDIFKLAAPFIVAFPDTEHLAEFPHTICVLAGAKSAFVKAETFKRLFPKAIITYLPDVGHWLHVDAPESFLRQVRSFLA